MSQELTEMLYCTRAVLMVLIRRMPHAVNKFMLSGATSAKLCRAPTPQHAAGLKMLSFAYFRPSVCLRRCLFLPFRGLEILCCWPFIIAREVCYKMLSRRVLI
jgi:hypothetical protein